MSAISELGKHLDYNYEKIKLNVMANLLRLLVDIYGSSKAKTKLNKVEGEEIIVNFPALHGSIVIRPHGGRLLAEIGESDTAIAKINFKVKDEQIYDVLGDIVKSSQRWGILKVFFKYILRGKIGIRGSIGANINTFKSLMIGDHEMYKRIKNQAI